MSLFESIDKSTGMMAALDHLDVEYRSFKFGWQQIRCPFTDNHAHGDRNPSASVNLALLTSVIFASPVPLELRTTGYSLELPPSIALMVISLIVSVMGLVVCELTLIPSVDEPSNTRVAP